VWNTINMRVLGIFTFLLLLVTACGGDSDTSMPATEKATTWDVVELPPDLLTDKSSFYSRVYGNVLEGPIGTEVPSITFMCSNEGEFFGIAVAPGHLVNTDIRGGGDEEHFGDDLSTLISYRFDQTESYQHRGHVIPPYLESFWLGNIYTPNGSQYFFDRMLAAERVLIQTYRVDGAVVTTEFDLSDMENNIKVPLEYCPYE